MKTGTERIFKSEGMVVYHQNLPKKQLKGHQHHEAHLFLPLAGHVEIEVKGQVYKVHAGKMMFLKGNTDHSFNSTTESGERIIVQFDESMNKKFKQVKAAAVLLPTHPLLKELALNLFPYAQSQFSSRMGDLILEILLDNLLSQTKTSDNMMFRIQEKVLASQDPVFKKVITVMESELELTLDEISERSGVSKRTLTRLIQEEMGLSPKELYTFFRIQRACELIYQNELGLTAIAFECGYSSLSQFIENFKRWTGMKPSEFRPSH